MYSLTVKILLNIACRRVIFAFLSIFVPTKRNGYMAKRKALNIPWGLISLLSLGIMAVSFNAFYLPGIIICGGVFLVSCIFAFNHFGDDLNTTIEKLSENGLY